MCLKTKNHVINFGVYLGPYSLNFDNTSSVVTCRHSMLSTNKKFRFKIFKYRKSTQGRKN